MENITEWLEGTMWLLLFGMGMLLFFCGIYFMDELITQLALQVFQDYILHFV